MTPDEYCQQQAAQSGSSFYYSFLFLPNDRRRAITALYAFCREVDDVVDECSDPALAHTKLVWWRSEVENLYAARPQHPVTQALAPHIESCGIRQELLNDVLDGMEMDLTTDRYADFAALRRYIYRVAGAVGLLAAGIFGYRNAQTLEYAERLGTAFQLTNIVRDVGEDARKGRIYIPTDELARFRVPVADVLALRQTEAFAELMRFQIARAQQSYDEAIGLLPPEDRRAQRPGLMMAAIYRTLLEEIRRDGCQVLSHRTTLTPIRKLWIAWKTWIAP
ncbi:MAG: presqualene diphosphate synthase HpnD [Betaproteobacteria bacterium]|jgi:phytoene synthase|nr:presqualene diphosphate synthase HpnD [Betaproteobacteria bacterium]